MPTGRMSGETQKCPKSMSEVEFDLVTQGAGPASAERKFGFERLPWGTGLSEAASPEGPS